MRSRFRFTSPFGQPKPRRIAAKQTEEMSLAAQISGRFDHLEFDAPEPAAEPLPDPWPVLKQACCSDNHPAREMRSIFAPTVKWPVVVRDNPASREQLQRLLEMAKREELPTNSRICPPTGRILDDWNVAVRGSVQSYAHAKKTGNTAWMNYELVDLDHLSFQVRVRGLGNPSRVPETGTETETKTAQAMRTESR